MIPAVNALQPGSAQRQQIRQCHARRHHQTAVAEIKQRWMKDKTGMLQHRIEIAAFDCWWKYPHEGIGPQHHKQ